jgi:hypothetical protein
MSWLTTLFAGGIDKVVSSVGEAADRLITSDEERLKLHNELALIQVKAQLDAQKQADDAEKQLEQEVTARWQADMGQDDKLAKRVRPASLLYLMGFMTVIILADSIDGLGFDVKESYVGLIETLLVTVFVAYFGSRGIEKVSQIRSRK